MQRKAIPTILFGSLIVIFGVVVLIDLFAKFIDIEVLLAWWPLLFVFIGFILVSLSDSRTVWTGAALLLAGTVVLAERVGILTGDFRPILIGIVILLIGLLVITPVVTAKKDE